VDQLIGSLRAHRRHAEGVHGYISAAARSELEREIARRRAAASPGALDSLRGLAALADERRRADRHDLRTRDRAQVEIQRALGRLRRCDSIDALVRQAPVELCRACGFTRAMISRVVGSAWVPVLPAWGVDEVADALRREFGEGLELPLQHMLLEAEMVRRRIAILVEDAAHDRRCHRAFVHAARATSYVGAPIVSGRRVIGFLHADRIGQDHPVTAEDREDVRLYADHFSLLHERAAIAAEIDRRTGVLLDGQRALAARLSALAGEELALAAHPSGEGEPAQIGSEDPPAPPRLPASLTLREQQILQLIATGATNRAIALELVLSENTIKTHIAKAIRKLHATSRADALARYLQQQAERHR
jgi:LuxR family transcriptional regulator, regulator of acetate metabolism